MNFIIKYKFLFLLFILLNIASFNSSYSSGLASGASCTITNSSGQLGGCDPDAGLICDSSLKICRDVNISICNTNSDCTIGKNCMLATDISQPNTGSKVGLCITSTGNKDENAMSAVFCNVYSILTGKAARGLTVIAVATVGVLFFMGKVQWGSIIGIFIGAALIFGGPSIVKVFVGEGFDCFVQSSSTL